MKIRFLFLMLVISSTIGLWSCQKEEAITIDEPKVDDSIEEVISHEAFLNKNEVSFTAVLDGEKVEWIPSENIHELGTSIGGSSMACSESHTLTAGIGHHMDTYYCKIETPEYSSEKELKSIFAVGVKQFDNSGAGFKFDLKLATDNTLFSTAIGSDLELELLKMEEIMSDTFIPKPRVRTWFSIKGKIQNEEKEITIENGQLIIDFMRKW